MVTYARRVRYGIGTLGVASGVPALHGSAGQPKVQGMTLPSGCGMPMAGALPQNTGPQNTEARAWLRRADVAAVRVLSFTVSLTVPTTTTKRDAFAGIAPGLRSTSPPV